MVQAWFIDDATENPKLEHHLDPPEYVPKQRLTFLTEVQIYQINVDDDCDKDETFLNLKKENGYNYTDICEIAVGKLIRFDDMLREFYSEHYHDDDEVRLFLDGSGYFDVRDCLDRWIRIKAEKGDLLILPAGIYHRFTPDTKDYAKVMRLFKSSPLWKAIGRAQDSEKNPLNNSKTRKAHLSKLAKNALVELKKDQEILELH